MGQGLATEVTHLGINQPPVFSSASIDAFPTITPRYFKWAKLCLFCM